jgi:hypothetical protein
LEKRRLARESRVITWNRALEKILHGDGFIVRNKTSLIGRFWWIPTTPMKGEVSFLEEVKDTGLLIVGYWERPSKRQLDNIALQGRMFTLDTEPFDRRHVKNCEV